GKKAVEAITGDDVKKLHAQVAAAVIGRRKTRAKERALASHDLSAHVSDDWKGHRTANKVVSLGEGRAGGRRTEGGQPRRVCGMVQAVAPATTPKRRRGNTGSKFSRARRKVDGREFLTLSLLTGARRQSLLAMRWVDIKARAARSLRQPWDTNRCSRRAPISTCRWMRFERRRSVRPSESRRRADIESGHVTLLQGVDLDFARIRKKVEACIEKFDELAQLEDREQFVWDLVDVCASAQSLHLNYLVKGTRTKPVQWTTQTLVRGLATAMQRQGLTPAISEYFDSDANEQQSLYLR